MRRFTPKRDKQKDSSYRLGESKRMPPSVDTTSKMPCSLELFPDLWDRMPLLDTTFLEAPVDPAWNFDGYGLDYHYPQLALSPTDVNWDCIDFNPSLARGVGRFEQVASTKGASSAQMAVAGAVANVYEERDVVEEKRERDDVLVVPSESDLDAHSDDLGDGKEEMKYHAHPVSKFNLFRRDKWAAFSDMGVAMDLDDAAELVRREWRNPVVKKQYEKVYKLQLDQHKAQISSERVAKSSRKPRNK